MTIACLSSLALLIAAWTPLDAQVTTATFYGIVQDPSGSSVAGAEVTLTHQRSGAVFRQMTTATGEFAFDFVPAGSLTLTIQMQGFKKYEASGIELGAAQRVRQSFTLDLGSTTETISVTAQAPLVNAASAEQRESLSEKQVSELPVSRRNLSNIIALAPGMTQDTASRRQMFIINGLGKIAASLTMDGIPASATSEFNSASVEGAFIGVVSMEAVEEVQISKGVFAAEYGRTLAGNVNVITKSGSNNWHGSLFELFAAEDLNARNTFLRNKPGVTFNQFGGSLGGPILRDKLFVFGAYEGYRLRSFQLVQTDTMSQRLRDQMLAANPAYKMILDAWPLPNQPLATPDALSGRFIGAGSSTGSTNHLVLKPDFWLSSALRISGTYVRDNPGETVPNALTLGPQTFDSNLDRVMVTVSAFRSRWSSESRFGWNRSDRTRTDAIFQVRDQAREETRLGGRRLPSIGITPLGISASGEVNALANAPSWSLEQKVVRPAGRHSLKFGGIYFREKAGRANVEVPILTYTSIADLLANIPGNSQFSFGVPAYQARNFNIGLFLQDDWRATSRLVLNLGLRYDYFSGWPTTGLGSSGPPHVFNAPLRFDNFTLGTPRFGNSAPADPDGFNYGPRLGFAYDVTGKGKTVVRGGAGVMFNPVNASMFALGTIVDPKEPYRSRFTRAENIALGIRYPIYNEDVLKLVASGSAQPSYQLVDPHIRAAYAINYTFSVQQALSSSMVLETAFVANRGAKFFFDRRYNEGDRFTGIRPNPAIADNLYFDNSESTRYFSWQTSLRKRYSRNMVWNAHYTWGKVIDYGSGDLGPVTNRSFLQDFYDIRSNRGRAHQDLAHQFNADALYELPRLERANAFLRHAAGGWQASGILRVRSGFPITLNQPSSRDRSRPDVVDFANAVLRNGRQWLNPQAFARVPVVAATGMPTRPGNAGRNVFDGPGAWRVDFSAGKNFSLGELVTLQFRADFFNVLNHDNPSGLNVNINSPTFGLLQGTEGPREAQLNLRLIF